MRTNDVCEIHTYHTLPAAKDTEDIRRDAFQLTQVHRVSRNENKKAYYVKLKDLRIWSQEFWAELLYGLSFFNCELVMTAVSVLAWFPCNSVQLIKHILLG